MKAQKEQETQRKKADLINEELPNIEDFKEKERFANYCYTMYNLRTTLESSSAEKIEKAVQDSLAWLDQHPSAGKNEYENKKQELKGVVALTMQAAKEMEATASRAARNELVTFLRNVTNLIKLFQNHLESDTKEKLVMVSNKLSPTHLEPCSSSTCCTRFTA